MVNNNRNRITNQRNLRRANKVIRDDFEDIIQEEIEDGTAPKPKSLMDKYKEIIAPLILATFATAMTAQNSITYQREVSSIAEQQLGKYTDHIQGILDNSLSKLNDIDVDKSTYNNLKSKGESVLDSIRVSDKSNVRTYQELSPKLLQQSLDNKVAQIESLADYTYNTNLLDYNGEPLYTHKVWDWSTLENTRHENMDQVTVPVDEMFEVYNEQTDETGWGLFPRDEENLDIGNVANCQCDLHYTNEDKIMTVDDQIQAVKDVENLPGYTDYGYRGRY